MKEKFRRPNEPVFWGFFGAGGMWGAIFAPAVILVLLLLPAFCVQAGVKVHSLFYSAAPGKIFMLCMIVLPLWCGMHRIHHCLHDLKVHAPIVKTICYGLAFIFSLVALCLIF